MCRTFANAVKILSTILIVLLLSFSLIFSGCGCTDKDSPLPPPQNNEESSNSNESNENSENSSNNEPENGSSSPETENNNGNNEETPAPPTTNPPSEDKNEGGIPENEEANDGGKTDGEENEGENNSPEPPPTENEEQNQDPEEPSTPTNDFSLSIKTFEALYSYSFENETFEIDFSKSKALYFEIKLLNNQEIVENVNFNICLSDNSFGIFDSVIYNSVFIEIQKVGEFEITISSNQHDFSKTFKIVVNLGE